MDIKSVIDKFEELKDDYNKLSKKISDPEVMSDSQKYQKLLRRHARLKKVVDKYKRYQDLEQQAEEAREMIEMSEDKEMEELAQDELNEIEPKLDRLSEELPLLLIPSDPDDDKNVITEIRSGAGGDEAALFAGDLFRMYSRYAEKHNWKVEILSSSSSGVGGFKEVIFNVEGDSVYEYLKYESGVHRVQRVPSTESSGRIHTSTATVAVLPEAEDVDVDIDQNDIRTDYFRSSGPGGQSVNTTDSAVRLTYEPLGITVSCQDEKSQHKNKARAMKILRARVKEKIEKEKQAERAEARKSQVGSGDRSEKIRTYNFPQGRVSDHRIHLTIHQLEAVLEGELDQIIEALQAEDKKKKLENL
ncbi:MAG: peptide chain release factor 1 [Bacillota bacterium]